MGLLLALRLTIGFVIGHRPRLTAYDLAHIAVPALAVFAGFRMCLAFESPMWLIGMSAFAVSGFVGLAVSISPRRLGRPVAA